MYWVNAEVDPRKPALIVADTGAMLTFGDLDDRSSRLANRLRADGLRPGDRAAILMENGCDLLVAIWAARRSGLLYIPVNWHLTRGEAAYILADSEARALITSEKLSPLALEAVEEAPGVQLRYCFGTAPPGFVGLDAVLAAEPPEPPEGEIAGCEMLYSSGTTGKPKGIVPAGVGGAFGALTRNELFYRDFHGVTQDKVVLTPGPLYHAAPLNWTMGPQKLGATVVVFTQFDAEQILSAIDRYGVTHCQMVPIHFVRLLKLPEDVRARYDVSSLERVVHAAAPCPVEVKEAMISWWGPVLYEYYAGSEGFGLTAIGPEEWLAHKGSVGTPVFGGPIHIVDDEGEDAPPGEVGLIYFENPRSFEYHNDSAHTARASNEKGWSTFGDMGWLDEAGYLYLADRKSSMIISGGVNIYPQEIEAELQMHPKVADVAVIGVPDDEFGEQVKAVIEPGAGVVVDAALEAELHAYARERLAGYKVPRSFDFVDRLPRTPAGKLLKREIRKRYWGDRKVMI